MGRNSKARRDARRRESSPRPGPTPGSVSGTPDPRPRESDLERAEALVLAETYACTHPSLTPAQRRRRIEVLFVRAQPLPVSMLGDALGALLVRLVGTNAEQGWQPDDLRELVRRHVGAEALPRLEGLLETTPRVVGNLHDREQIVAGFELAAAIGRLPPIPRVVLSTGGAADDVPDDLRRKLATVRALLAKAESTAYDEEAESLTAKAQELVSRYALESLLARTEAGEQQTTTTRIWLDAPYVDAKASLVTQVAAANRCRSVGTSFELCLVVGAPSDLAYVELLVTSLLVQAARAVARAGSHVDGRGVSRTRSFRQSFLISFAVRIGQRLREAAEQAVTDHTPDSRLLPAIIDQERRVEEAFEELFPHTTSTRKAVTNHAGWRAGAVAADLAQLDVHKPVPRADAG